MANRDEILRFVVQTEQGKDLLGLAKDIAAVGDAAGQAESEANAFLAEFANAARLQSAADQFRALGRSVIEYEGKIRAAKTQLSVLGKEISGTAEPTRKQEAAFAAAKRELDRLTSTQDRQRSALRDLRAELESGGISVRNLARGTQELGDRSTAASDGLRDLAERTKQAAVEQDVLAARQRDAVAAAVQLSTTFASDGLRAHRDRQQQAAAAASALAQKEGDAAKVLRELSAASRVDGLAQLAQGIEAVAEAAGKGEPRARDLVEEFKRLNEASGAVNSLAQLKARLQETGDRLWQARRGLSELATQFSASERSTKEFADAYRSAQKVVDDLAREERLLEIEVKKASGTVQKHGLDVNNLSGAEQQLRDRTQQASQAIREYASSLGTAGQGADAARGKTENSGNAFDKFRAKVNSAARSLLQITGIAGAVSAALSAIGVGRLFSGALESATEFEAKLSAIRAVAGATPEQLARMKKAAEDAGKTTKFSAAEAADALGELARASGDADAAIAQLAPTLNLAQAAGIGTAESATILTTTLTQFGLAATDATHVADIFAREANSTQDTVSALGLAMSYVAPLARQLGMSLEQTTAVLGALAQEGFKGERAGTALRNVFSQLLDPTSRFNGALRGLGINSKDFTEVIKRLAAAGDRGKAALLALDAEARPAIQALVTSGGANIQRLVEDFKNADGEAERTARIMGENFEGASKRLKNAFDQMRRDIVDPILEPLAKQFDDVAKRIRAFIETAEFDRIVESIKTFVLDATASLIEFGRAVDYGAIANKIKDLSGESSKFFKELKENVSSVVSAISIAGSIISGVFNTVQTVILGAATVWVGSMSLLVRAIKQAVVATSFLSGGAGQVAGAVERLDEVIGGLDAVTEEFARRTKKNAKETAQAFIDLAADVEDAGNKSEDAAGKFEKPADAAKRSSGEVTKYADSLGLVPDYAAAAGESSASLAETISRLPYVTQVAGSALGDFQKKLSAKQEWAAAEVEVAQLSRQLAELTIKGQENSEEFQRVHAEWEKAAQRARDLKIAAQGPGPELEKLKQAYAGLGVAMQEDLASAARVARENFDTIRASSRGTAEDINKTKEAFIAYAQKAIEAVAASDDATKAQTASMLRGLAAQVQASAELEKLLGRHDAVGAAAANAGQKVVNAGEAGSRALKQTSDAAGKAKDSIKEAGKTAEAVTVSFASIGRASFKAVADLYSLVLARKGSTRDLQFEIDKATDRLKAQESAAASLTTTLQHMDDAGARAFANQAGGAEFARNSLLSLAAAARRGEGAFDELNQSKLDGVAAAAESAAAKIDEIRQRAVEAKAALRGMADSAQDEIDRIRGNETAIEDRRYKERLRQIEEQAALLGSTTSEELQRARMVEAELHALRLANIATEQAERNRSGGGGSGAPSVHPPAAPSSTGGGGGGVSVVNNFSFDGLVLTGTKEQVQEQLARLTAPALRRMWDRGVQ